MLVILENNIKVDDNEVSIPWLTKNPNMVTSIAIIPPGKNDSVPIVIGTRDIIVVSGKDRGMLKDTKM